MFNKLLSIAFLSLFLFATAQNNANPIQKSTKSFLVTIKDGVEYFKEIKADDPSPDYGAIVEYRIQLKNTGSDILPSGNVSVVSPIPERTSFVKGSASPSSSTLATEVSTDGDNFKRLSELSAQIKAEDIKSIKWTILEDMAPNKVIDLKYRVRINDNPIVVSLKTLLVNNIDGKEVLSESTKARPGQIIEYRFNIKNRSQDILPNGAVTIVGPVLEGTTYIIGSATSSSAQVLVEFSTDGSTFKQERVLTNAKPEEYKSIRWTILEDVKPGTEYNFVYRVRMNKN